MSFLKSLSILLVTLLCNEIIYAQKYQGYFNFEYNDSTGKLLFKMDKLNQDILMVNAFGTGVGSNDLGLDRGKLGDIRVVRFEKHGDKILLIQQNLKYRANSNNALEVRAVEEAFAKSVIFGFKIEKTENQIYYIDMAPLLFDDLNLVANTLKDTKQGTYKLEKSRCALFFDNIHAFPKNIELESILTFVGEPVGANIKSVTPAPEAVSYRQHVSFIELPDDKYKPRSFHPESGYFYTSYYDYATPIHNPIEKRFITRHRLEKKYPDQAVSEPIEPIIYYIDPGCPDPIKSALVEGGKWWAQAYEAAGFKNAFDVRELPEGAHPLDVRYNMIQWVHRSTRGWSYGSSIADPRTGEILKGHVSLGSLRVRQDFMIAQGIASPYGTGDDNHGIMTKMALDRLKQLSAHEIGHTIGLAHNFAASTNEKASVMDYPHPYITLDQQGKPDFSKAYDDKIGLWDKRAIMFGYSQYKDEGSEKTGLEEIINGNHALGLRYLTDEDARSVGSASPHNHLWDNGADPIVELDRIMAVRAYALKEFGLNTIPKGTPVSELEKIFVPLYYMHRYQTEAVGKLIGGLEYHYAVKGFGKIEPLKPVDLSRQSKATMALLNLLSEKHLGIPQHIQGFLYPPASGYNRSRESFPTGSSPAFDYIKVYESASGQIMELLLHPERLSRIVNEGRLGVYLKDISNTIAKSITTDVVAQSANTQFVSRLLGMKMAENTSHHLKANIINILEYHKKTLDKIAKKSTDENSKLLIHYLISLIDADPDEISHLKIPQSPPMPPGAPIGSCSLDD